MLPEKPDQAWCLKKFLEEEDNTDIPPPSIYFSYLPESPLHIVYYSLDIDEPSKITKIGF